MISSEHRFHGLGSLNYIYRHGQTLRSPLLSVKFILNPRRATWRAAVVVSRKVNKSAVVRNRIRRRVYEVLRSEVKITESYDIVLTIFSDEVEKLSPKDLNRLVHNQLRKAGIISPANRPGAHAIVETKD